MDDSLPTPPMSPPSKRASPSQAPLSAVPTPPPPSTVPSGISALSSFMDDTGHPVQWVGTPQIAGESDRAKFLVLTLALAGQQLVMSVLTAYVNPLLQQRGISRTVGALVWAAGPISGLVVQPVVGALSDQCTARLGRRRPFIIGGSITLVLCLLLLGWARLPQVIFFAAILCDVAVNTVQATCRALVVDSLALEQQRSGSGWGGRMVAIGNLIGYILGQFDFGQYQLEITCGLAAVALTICITITCYSVEERRLVGQPLRPISQTLITNNIKAFKLLAHTWRHNIPVTLEKILTIQFFAWMAWFSFLFYASAWTSDMLLENRDKSDHSLPDFMSTVVSREASLSLAIFAGVAFLFSLVLPEVMSGRIASDSDSTGAKVAASILAPLYTVLVRIIRMIRRALRHLLFGVTLPISVRNVSIVDLWVTSHVVFVIAMFSTFFVKSAASSRFVFVLLGFPWAITTWVPYALIAEFISSQHDEDSQTAKYSASIKLDIALPSSPEKVKKGHKVQRSLSEEDFYEMPLTACVNEATGIYLGLHNMALTAPQILASLVSMTLFSMGFSVISVIRLGAVPVAFACYRALQLRELKDSGRERLEQAEMIEMHEFV